MYHPISRPSFTNVVLPLPDPAPKSRPTWRWVAVWLSVGLLLATVIHFVLGWVMDFVTTMDAMSATKTFRSLLIISLIVYTVLIATPFMPGIEVGIALLVLQGASVAPFVYLATVTGLMIAYLIGNKIPLSWLRKIAGDLGLQRLCAFLDQMDQTPPTDRLAKQRAMLPKWLSAIVVDYRYVTLGALLNIPGTFAIGGGGGILMTAGLSRLFNGWYVLLTLAIATLPVPLLVWLFGVSLIA